MKNLKSIRIAVLMLLFTYSFVVFCGCIYHNENYSSDKQKLIEQMKQDCKDDSIDLIATPFGQEAVLSAVFSLSVKIVDEGIYVGDDLYDKIECISNPDIIFNNVISAHKDITNEECSKVIEKIKNAESCYVLETESLNAKSKIIAVYKIDEAYYFLSFIPNTEYQVGRIHYMKIK